MITSSEFSRFPKGWKVLPFLDVFKDVTSKGTKVKKENYNPEGALPVVDQGKKLFGGFTSIKNKADVTLPAIIFGDHTKIFKLIDIEFAVGADGVKLLEPKVEADKKFLFFYLNQLQLEDAGYSRHFKFLKETYIPLPPLETQKKIVAVLEKADQLRKDCKQMEQELNSLAQSVLIDMFGDPVTNPKGWEISDIGSTFLLLTDYHANGSYEVLQENVELLEQGYALMVRTTDLEKNNFTTGVKYISEHAYNYLTKTKVFGGELIVNKIGSAGKLYLMPTLNRPVSLAMNQFMVRFDEKKALPVFMYHLLSSQHGFHEINKKVQGAVTKTIRKDALRSIEMPIPPVSKQKIFCEFIEKQNVLLSEQSALLEQYQLQFNALMQKAFNGELNLDNAKTQ